MLVSLAGKRVVVLGGSSGVGFAVASLALHQGARVHIGSSNYTKVESALKRLGQGASGSTVNVGADESVAEFFSNVGSLDHLVFTAGDGGSVLTPKSLAELNLAEAGDGFAVRFWGAVRAVKHAEPYLSNEGSITLTSGVMSRRPRKGLMLAGAISGAVEHLVQGLAVELAPRRVNAVCLGLILTDDHARSMSPDQIQKATASQLLVRPGTAEEAGQAYLYAMLASYTTGQVIVADGGRTFG